LFASIIVHPSLRLGLCHANTGRESLVRVAQNLSEAIHAKFHVAEAIKRESVVVVKTPA